MRITNSLLLALALVLGAQSLAHAQAAPAVMPMQGYLTDEAGAAISGPTTMTFSLYTTETGGTAIYTEDQSVMVDGGYFTAYVGDVTPLDLAVFRDNGTVYVGIRVGAGAELAPRAQLGSVPYAAFAQHSAEVPFAGITGVPTGLADGDNDTTYSAGTGLSLSGTTFSVNSGAVQSRVSGTCPAGQAIRTINADGTVVCQSASGGGVGTLQTTYTTQTASIPAGGSMDSIEGMACPAGYTVISGGCHPGYNPNVYLRNNFPNLTANTWRCGFGNTGGSAATVYVYTTCGRVM
jgi:hypothetical protein